MMSAKYGKKDDIDYELLYTYLNEKHAEDLAILEVKRSILSKSDFYMMKIKLTEIEHQLLLIRKKQNG